jgi:hypothetical protein
MLLSLLMNQVSQAVKAVGKREVDAWWNGDRDFLHIWTWVLLLLSITVAMLTSSTRRFGRFDVMARIFGSISGREERKGEI